MSDRFIFVLKAHEILFRQNIPGFMKVVMATIYNKPLIVFKLNIYAEEKVTKPRTSNLEQPFEDFAHNLLQ